VALLPAYSNRSLLPTLMKTTDLETMSYEQFPIIWTTDVKLSSWSLML
jgi:hypothetical protein